MKKLFIVAGADWFFLSHRLPIALAAQYDGWDVTIVTKNTGKKQEVLDSGLNFIDLNIARSGTNPLNELQTLRELVAIYKTHKPDVLHHVAIKTCIYGSVAAKIAGIKNVVNAITGLGYNFSGDRKGALSSFLKRLLKYSIRGKSYRFIFQNNDDRGFMQSLANISDSQISLIKGSGVDLTEYSFQPEPESMKVKLILPARMLYDKGVVEFVAAAKMIRDEMKEKAVFALVGSIDLHNKAGISEEAIQKLLEPGYIVYEGFSADVVSTLKNCHVVVLPSYREGMPKSLIDACAIGRPIITTDTPGCRDCVTEGKNGFLVPVKNHVLLADRMKILIEDEALRKQMGRESRKLAEREFGIEIPVRETLKIYNSFLK